MSGAYDHRQPRRQRFALERRRSGRIRQVTCHLNPPPSTIPREARHGADERGVTEAMATPLPSCEAMQAAPLAKR